MIKQIRLGTSNVYLIKGNEGYILIDAGNKGQINKFCKFIKELGVSPDEIKLILITHAHFDHVGGLAELKKLCKCKAAVHQLECQLLQNGEIIIPPGTNFFTKGVSWLGRKFLQGSNRMAPVNPEIIVAEDGVLSAYGIDGTIIHTPGHSKGSISVILSTGEAFIGDVAVNYLPFGQGPIYPPFAEDTGDLLTSWKKLIEANVKTIYPGHGKPFDISVLERARRNWLSK